MTTILVLLVGGLLLVVAEVLFPSFGVLGLASAASLVVADVLLYRELGGGALALAIAAEVVAVPLLVRFAFRLLPRFGFGRKMMLPAKSSESASAIEPAGHLVGTLGTATSDLRPSGTAALGTERRAVVAETDFVAAGTPVRVVAVEGFRIVVRPATDTRAP